MRHTTNKCKVLQAMNRKHRQKKKKYVKSYGQNKKELSILIEKKFQKFVKNKKRMKTEKELQYFQES